MTIPVPETTTTPDGQTFLTFTRSTATPVPSEIPTATGLVDAPQATTAPLPPPPAASATVSPTAPLPPPPAAASATYQVATSWPTPDASPPPATAVLHAPSPVAQAGPVTTNSATSVVVQNSVRPLKSPGVAAVLAFFFGPLGMLYATIPGAAIIFAANLVIAVITVVTFGLGAVLWFGTWIAGVVWAVAAANQHNSQAATTTVAVATGVMT